MSLAFVCLLLCFFVCGLSQDRILWGRALEFIHSLFLIAEVLRNVNLLGPE